MGGGLTSGFFRDKAFTALAFIFNCNWFASFRLGTQSRQSRNSGIIEPEDAAIDTADRQVILHKEMKLHVYIGDCSSAIIHK